MPRRFASSELHQFPHHFAIVLDNDLVSTPFINFREYPDGIDGQTGAEISGGFTIRSAQDMANFLKIGALPEIHAALVKRGLDSFSATPEQLDKIRKEDFERMGEVIKAANIKLQD